jgi:metallo-beta-lactamase family protein
MSEGSSNDSGDTSATLHFLGAAREVTGSCYRIDTPHAHFLVDCGMFQGAGDAHTRNAAALEFNCTEIDFVLLTHAHIDHSGLLPALVARGFRGPIHATPATCDLVDVMLRDSAHIQQKDSDRTARRTHERTAARVDSPLYTIADVETCIGQLRPVEYGEMFEPAASVRARFADAGHILGSSIVEVWIAKRKIVFSGDLGQPDRPLLHDPTPIAQADTLVVESTYGNRLHKPLVESVSEFARIVSATLPHGNVVIPAFAVGRTQEILHVLAELARDGRVPALTVFVDSPLASRATAITAKYASTLDQESHDVDAWISAHRDRLRVRFTESPQDSMAINAIRSGAIVIAASGMCDAGRIRHHLRHNIGRAECAIVFTGFQAVGTLGRQIVDGVRTVRLFGDDIHVNASIHTIGGLSAHADQAALLQWLAHFDPAPSRCFVVHGEETTAVGFAALVRERLHWPSVEVPQRGDGIAL